MKHFKQYKWFWLTFGGWCFIAALTSQASIFSPLKLDSQTFSEFKVQVNKSVENNKFYRDQPSLIQAMESITRDWEAGGWKNISGGLNLATVFFDAGNAPPEALASIAQLRLFQNEEGYKLLGLLRDQNRGGTYRWVSEIPKDAFQNPQPTQNDFPILPPPEAKNVSLLGSPKTSSLSWTQIKTSDFKRKFNALCLSRGFIEKTTSPPGHPGEQVYVLSGRSALIMTVLLDQGDSFSISMVKVTGN